MLGSAALLLSLLAPGSQAQDAPAAPPPSEEPGPQASSRDERSLETLLALTVSRAEKERRLADVRAELEQTTNEYRKVQLLQAERTLQTELDALQADFESIATGLDVSSFDRTTEEAFDLQTELLNLVQPLVEELKDATEAPRQIERMRGEIDRLMGREQIAVEALRGIERLLGTTTDPGLGAALEESRQDWQGRRNEVAARLTVARFQLEKRLADRTSILESTRTAISEFFRTRGLNLLLAVATFFAVLFGIRAAYRRVLRLVRSKSRETRRFYARLADVLTFGLAGIFALMGALLVLYATGDWVLLGLALLFLLGLVWASKTAIPLFLEQIRLLLDLGTVREHERIVYSGIPYKVTRLSTSTMLTNPELAGGVVRLPLKDLIDLRSRPCSKEEVWFPCKRGDWVLLSDGSRGKVVHQSPEFVQIEPLGGGHVTFPTTDFLGLVPRNLSHGFRVKVRFGIDYAHQAICTTEVPRIMLERLERELAAQYPQEHLLKLGVEFLEAGASSLDYVVLADWDGAAAPAYERCQRAIQRTLVDLCNEQGWNIPFPQLTVHKAAVPG